MPEDGETALGELRSRLHVDSLGDGLVRGEVEYRADGETWRHSFVMRVFADEAELRAALAEAGLGLERRLDALWFVAVPI